MRSPCERRRSSSTPDLTQPTFRFPEPMARESMTPPRSSPSQLVIVGGGFIGLEFAQMFARFGSQVTLLEAGETFVPALDTDIAERVRNMLEGEGVTVVTGAQVTSCDETVDHADSFALIRGGHVDVVTDDQTFAADAVLVAAGRRPATEDLDLTAAGVATDERGYITVDDQLRTNIDGVYAVGDVNGGPQFTYISLDDNRVLWDTLHDGPRRRDDRVAVPATTFPAAVPGRHDDAPGPGVRSLRARGNQGRRHDRRHAAT